MTLKRKTRAFTLIELLVVISIIAVLISILVPALSAAKANGAKVKCLANLRSIMASALSYANDDPNSIVGPVHFNAHRFINEGYAEYGGGPGDMNFVNWNEQFDPRTRPLNLITEGFDNIQPTTAPGDRAVFKVYQCPGDDFGWQIVPGFNSDPRETERPYFTGNGTAFRMNNLKEDNGIFAGIYGRPISRIPDTGATVGFLEARAFETLFTNLPYGTLRGPRGNPIELTSYHKRLGFFNLAYCDGHASFADMGLGTHYNQLPEFQKRDFRGSWGRMDCLPDPAYADDDF